MSTATVFYTVFQFSPAIKDFEVKGIYTLQPEADAHAERIATPEFKSIVLPLSHEAVVEHLISNRLGKLYDVLKAIEQKVSA